MALNLHLLRLFTTVAQCESFSRAGDALAISQSAVSKGVREFERQVGVALLDRTRGSVVLTDAGQALLHHAKLLFTIERGAEAELQAFRGIERGGLHIGASTTIATYILPPILGLFHEAHPTIQLRLTSANTRDIANLLTSRSIDLAFVEGPVDLPGLTLTPWRVDELVIVSAPSHPLAMGRKATTRDLAQHRHIVREHGSGTRDVVDSALRDLGVIPTETMEVDSTAAIMQAVAAGLGIAVISRTAAADMLALGKLQIINVTGVTIGRSLNRLTIAGRPLSSAALMFDRFAAQADRGTRKQQIDYVI
ncbi:MAG: LysR family transcriptional regulator [Chelatococcus sp.]|jgi:DNA-binding transcriptional LysR family regulator|uniref:LysR family transcriptional regulator n=1 Tax=Chelatococcus sp. TaxID=1953771 RepID=UPI0025BF4DA4|nr:LysR family transcriptional regulator [Chelatococcus sp.]MBX3539712.1 LysR family transcriptional regulator [Chelatococcus sp.]